MRSVKNIDDVKNIENVKNVKESIYGEPIYGLCCKCKRTIRVDIADHQTVRCPHCDCSDIYCNKIN
jgi:hypothetical protein